MSGKYSSLPDIDSAPDVFETPDEPELRQRLDDDNGEDHRRAGLTATAKEIDTTGLPPRRRTGDRFAASGSSSLDSSTPNETPLARLRRLQAEVSQLEQEMVANPVEGAVNADGMSSVQRRRPVVPARPKVDVISELSTLRERLNVLAGEGPNTSTTPSLDWLPRLQRLDHQQTGSKAPSVQVKDVEHIELGDVDRRLASLEQQIGTADDENTAPSLTETIGRIDSVLTILTQPRHLDSIARRVKLLLVDLDRASAASRRTGATTPGNDRGTNSNLSQSDHESLQALLTLLPRLDPLIPIIPPLLSRLRSLSGLHAEALGIAADLRELQSTGRVISEEELELQSIVSGVQQGISEAIAGISSNWDAVQQRIAALEGRVQDLH